MAIDKENFPIVLTIIENFGLSSSFTGNAVASANPVNFYSMWGNNPHTVLYPNKINHTSSYENSDIDLTRLFAGRDVLSDKKYLDQVIESNELKENKKLKKLLIESSEHNSAIHLIGNLPGPNDKHADLNHLLSLIESVKGKNIFRVYLHLIVDDNANENLASVEKFILKIRQIGICEIASVVGKKYLNDSSNDARGFAKAVSTIVSGDGDKALTAEQALNFKGLSRASNKKPTSVLFKNRYSCRLSNFDTVIFFNHNNRSFSKLVLFLITGSGSSSRLRLPKFLKIASFFNPLDQDLDQLEVLFQRDATESLAQSLFSANIDQLFLSDTSRVSTINKHLKGQITGGGGNIKELYVPVIQGSNPAYYNQVLDLMLKQISIYLGQKKTRFITLLIPVLSMPNITTFAQTVGIIKMLDSFLPKLETEVMNNNGVLILTSDHGGTEKMSERDIFETINSKTNNPVPLIFSVPGYKICKEDKKETVPNRMLYDMIKKSHFVGDLAPTILELFHIPVPPIITGKSFLSELKVESK